MRARDTIRRFVARVVRPDRRICGNPDHDHLAYEGTEVALPYAPRSATRYPDGNVAVLTEPSPARCDDCGAPVHWDEGPQAWVHDDQSKRCFLIQRPTIGATPCCKP